MNYLGIEIGGTKLQLGVGPGDGTLAALWRGNVDVSQEAEGIRQQITAAVPELLARAGLDRSQIHGVGVGFGGPVDDATRTVIKSHQIQGWDNFALAAWVEELLGWPAVLGNDADVAGLAEAHYGAGKGLSPIFYVTIGSGIGGGLIIDGKIYRGCGRGAAEIGHLTHEVIEWSAAGRMSGRTTMIVEEISSGWAIQRKAREMLDVDPDLSRPLLDLVGGDPDAITTPHVAHLAAQGDPYCQWIVNDAVFFLSCAIRQVIALLGPRRMVIGGGVSHLGEQLLFEPLRNRVARQVFKPFASSYDIVPAALGEEVVVHGALTLACQQFAPRAGTADPGQPGKFSATS